MNGPLEHLFYDFGQKIMGYLPNAVAGVLLLAVGWFLGWFLKRVIIRVLIILRLDRLFRKFEWGEDLAKGDVRYAFYNVVGNITFLVVFLVFLSGALTVMNLAVLSNLLEKGIYFLPRLVIALLIFTLGWFIATSAASAIRKALVREEIPRSALIARFSKFILLLFFSAMALAELDIAREIVIIGFTTIMITLAILVVVITARGGKTFINKILQSLEEE
jgi:Mechanosensitive ion channel, conserved TM helix